jgi:Zn-dependent M32 family carboxypeptidase
MAVGRDAADVALTTSFGQADLKSFFVVTEEETGHARLASGLDSAPANEPLALAS